MKLESINPASEEVLHIYPEVQDPEIEQKISLADQAYKDWKKRDPAEKSKLMQAVADQLLKDCEGLSKLITKEMGKPIREAEAEIKKCAWVCEYYAEHAGEFLQDEIIPSDAGKSWVSYEPLGCVLAVMPWNFPFWQVFRFAAPAIMAGNVGLLKHASNVPQCALAIEECFTRAGFPPGIFQALLVSSSKVEQLIHDERIKAITLTGSDLAGSKVAETAGFCLKKTVLELGGNDPLIVLDDADLEAAARTAVQSRMINTGQSCIAAKRFIVVDSVAGEFTQRVHDLIEALIIGDPMDPDTDIGPLAREDLVIDLERQVNESIMLGAKCLTGGKRPNLAGAYYLPTLLVDVNENMPVFFEEVFGPVAAIISAKDETEAIELANHSEFGLGAAIWTKDLERARRLAGELESGCVFVNELVKSDPRLPFGGVKRSGFGRELSYHGIREFTNVKTVWIK